MNTTRGNSGGNYQQDGGEAPPAPIYYSEEPAAYEYQQGPASQSDSSTAHSGTGSLFHYGASAASNQLLPSQLILRDAPNSSYAAGQAPYQPSFHETQQSTGYYPSPEADYGIASMAALELQHLYHQQLGAPGPYSQLQNGHTTDDYNYSNLRLQDSNPQAAQSEDFIQRAQSLQVHMRPSTLADLLPQVQGHQLAQPLQSLWHNVEDAGTQGWIDTTPGLQYGEFVEDWTGAYEPSMTEGMMQEEPAQSRGRARNANHSRPANSRRPPRDPDSLSPDRSVLTTNPPARMQRKENKVSRAAKETGPPPDDRAIHPKSNDAVPRDIPHFKAPYKYPADFFCMVCLTSFGTDRKLAVAHVSGRVACKGSQCRLDCHDAWKSTCPFYTSNHLNHCKPFCSEADLVDHHWRHKNHQTVSTEYGCFSCEHVSKSAAEAKAHMEDMKSKGHEICEAEGSSVWIQNRKTKQLQEVGFCWMHFKESENLIAHKAAAECSGCRMHFMRKGAKELHMEAFHGSA
ncbi:hypothetical protein BJ508DRAFT_375431 [Ascobolus immersus RN42]|uniref:C2H2-type domain-containing protein n=1 Tax=Ascobolus immersus RN42 TaxID=1160509 RepID=A0A3N4IE37_ASCIM|nr:hypothetical protein BJ508DRAFT_375431 [Ascobolus immersus RN42]